MPKASVTTTSPASTRRSSGPDAVRGARDAPDASVTRSKRSTIGPSGTASVTSPPSISIEVAPGGWPVSEAGPEVGTVGSPPVCASGWDAAPAAATPRRPISTMTSTVAMPRAIVAFPIVPPTVQGVTVSWNGWRECNLRPPASGSAGLNGIGPTDPPAGNRRTEPRGLCDRPYPNPPASASNRRTVPLPPSLERMATRPRGATAGA